MLRPSISDTRRSSAIAMPRAMTEHLQFSPDSAGVADDKGATTAAQRKRKRRRQYERATVLEWGFTPCGQITVVFVAWVLLIILGSLLYSAALSADGTEVIVNGTFGRAVWWAYILFIDSGTQTSLSPDDHNPWILVVAVYVLQPIYVFASVRPLDTSAVSACRVHFWVGFFLTRAFYLHAADCE